jgi:hypothetical protein
MMIAIPVMKPCFHVVCKTCVDELVHPSKQCVVCDHEVRAEVDVLELKREGSKVVLISVQSIPGGSPPTGFFSRNGLCCRRVGGD